MKTRDVYYSVIFFPTDIFHGAVTFAQRTRIFPKARRLNVIIFDYYTRVRHGISVLVVLRKSSTSVSRSSGFFFTFFPPLLLFLSQNVLRKNSHAESTSEPLVLPSSVPTAVRHGVNGETKRSESDTLPLSCVPPCVEAGETKIRVCVHCVRLCACFHSCVRMHPRCNISYSLTTGYSEDYRIESSR